MCLHGFGVKTGGLHLYGHQLASADSTEWSCARPLTVVATRLRCTKELEPERLPLKSEWPREPQPASPAAGAPFREVRALRA
jgi:hypothetical protein